MRARILLPLAILLVVFLAAWLLQDLLTHDTLARERDRKKIGPNTLRLVVGGDRPRLRIPDGR